MNRRQIIGAIGTAWTGVFAAGCSQDGPDEATDTPASTPTETATATPAATPTETKTSTPETETPKPGPTVSVMPRRVIGTVARLLGEVKSLDGHDSVTIEIKYRELNTETWHTSDPVTVSKPGRFIVTLTGLTRQRYYRYYMVVRAGDTKVTTDRKLFATSSGSAPHPSQPWTDYRLGPRSGFAAMGRWYNNNTPYIVVRKPTREQLERALSVDGQRIVVFTTSGTIDLGGKPITISNERCWIAGQIAPDPGVTLTRGELRVEANRSLVQHVRVRPGDGGKAGGRSWAPSGIRVGSGVQDVVVDHCSVTWAVDSGITVGSGATNVTVSNCLVAEGLQNAGHPKGRMGHAMTVADSKKVSLMANGFAYNNGRHPRLGGGSEGAAINDLVHTYRSGMELGGKATGTLVGGVFEDPRTEEAAVSGSGTAYVADTTVKGGVPTVGERVTRSDSREVWPSRVSPLPASETKAHVLKNAGAWPAYRTNTDARIVGNVRSGGGKYINSQSEVGGYPTLPENTMEVETPESGVRTWMYEQALTVEREGYSASSGHQY